MPENKNTDSKAEIKQQNEIKKVEKKKIVIIVSVILALLLIAMIPVIIITINNRNDGGDTPNTGETFFGTFTFELPVGIDSYVFKEGNKVEHRFVDVNVDPSTEENEEAEVVTVVYSYVIAIENGNKVIKLTDDTTGEIITYSFDKGVSTRDLNKCSNELCPIRDPKPLKDDSNTCECGIGKLSVITMRSEILIINEEFYYGEEQQIK